MACLALIARTGDSIGNWNFQSPEVDMGSLSKFEQPRGDNWVTGRWLLPLLKAWGRDIGVAGRRLTEKEFCYRKQGDRLKAFILEVIESYKNR